MLTLRCSRPCYAAGFMGDGRSCKAINQCDEAVSISCAMLRQSVPHNHRPL